MIVRRRHVYFFAGFDPKGASFYHRLYREESAKQAALAGYLVKTGARLKLPHGSDAWPVHMEQGGVVCESRIEHVRWDDLVRAHWPRSVAPLLWDMARSYAYALQSGVIPAVGRIAPKTLVAWLYPMVFMLFIALAGLGGAALVASWLAQSALGVLAWVLVFPSLALAVFWAGARLEARLNTGWLARIFRFASLQARDRIEGLEQRLDAAAATIAHSLSQDDIDEVLIVGFSVGSILAASAAARALPLAPQAQAKLSLLTLGHCIPMLGLLPQAQRFRHELAILAEAQNLVWIDFSSTTDWGSFAMVDPLKACLGGEFTVQGKPRDPGAQGARTRWRSPRFHTLFDAQGYVQIRRDKRRMHMQYLMAGHKVGEYDYFALTAGPLPLSKQLG